MNQQSYVSLILGRTIEHSEHLFFFNKNVYDEIKGEKKKSNYPKSNQNKKVSDP